SAALLKLAAFLVAASCVRLEPASDIAMLIAMVTSVRPASAGGTSLRDSGCTGVPSTLHPGRGAAAALPPGHGRRRACLSGSSTRAIATSPRHASENAAGVSGTVIL